MGMSSSQPQPITQGTMGSPTKNYGPVGDMLGSAQNQVNPQSSPTVLTSTVPPTSNQYTDPNSSGMPQHVRDGMSPGQFPTNYNPRGNNLPNPGFMPMGNAGFMPMGFGQMPQQPQMPMFGGPRGGKAPQ